MKRGRVKSNSGLNLREKPNGEKVGLLKHNDILDIIDEVTFYRVKTSTGKLGFVHGDYVESLPDTRRFVETDGEKLQASIDSPSDEFELMEYTASQFVGSAVKVDRDFAAHLNKVNAFAKARDLKIYVTSSTRSINQQVQGAIVPPATRSCHFIGHAIDMNLMLNGKLFNSRALRRNNITNLPPEIGAFIDDIRADEHLRWGGDFRTEDPVHIDDNFYHRKTLLYKAKLFSRVRQLNR
jgi:hypothetical protein